ncbi:cytochrome P450 [Marasmius fiardii PR-910]|nr:cytochrome P450 [Marasmius fiardii PR-910]
MFSNSVSVFPRIPCTQQMAMSATIPLWPFAVITLVVTSILSFRRTKGSKQSYPPGPKPRPLLGNFFDLPIDQSWKAYKDLGKIYVVLNSENLANRMLEQRSQIYSDRPFIPMAELMGWAEVNTGMLRYGPDWRMHRRIYTQAFRSTVVPEDQPIISSKTSRLLSSLRQSPNLFIDHVKTYAAAAILATVYGYDVLPSNDSLRDIRGKQDYHGSYTSFGGCGERLAIPPSSPPRVSRI